MLYPRGLVLLCDAYVLSFLRRECAPLLILLLFYTCYCLHYHDVIWWSLIVTFAGNYELIHSTRGYIFQKILLA